MKNRRRQTDNLEVRIGLLEETCSKIGKATEENQKVLVDHGKVHLKIMEKLDTLNENTQDVVRAYNDARTWIRVTKWGSGVIALFTGVIYGLLKIKGGS